MFATGRRRIFLHSYSFSVMSLGETSMRILVVEDDNKIASFVVNGLKQNGFAVDRCADGEEGHLLASTTNYDGAIFDIMLPKLDGLSLIQRLRREGAKVPIIILSAKASVEDRVRGLQAGADDYVTKPFHLEEILARLRALVRRATGHATSDLICGPVRVDTRAGRVFVNDEAIRLTSHEFRLISYLMHHVGRIVSRTELVEHLYDQDFDRDSNTIEVFVGRLRKKLGVDVIKTIRGLGYVIEPPTEARASE